MPEEPPPTVGAALRRELVLHLAAGALGSTVGVALIGTVVPGLVWRAAALSSALTLVIVGLVRAFGLGRAEWRGAAPRTADYRRVIGRFAVAFVLVIVASS